MASVNELLLAAQNTTNSRKSPFLSLLEGAAQGFGQGLKDEPARRHIELQSQLLQQQIQQKQDDQRRLAEQDKQIREELAGKVEQARKSALGQVNGTPTDSTPANKLKTETDYKINPHGRYEKTVKVIEQPTSPASTQNAEPILKNIGGVDYMEITGANGLKHYQAIPPRQPTSSEFIARGYADKAQEGSQALDSLVAKGFNPSSTGAAMQSFLPSALQSQDVKALENAKLLFGNAIARRESGATIKDDEMARYNLTYFPAPNDSSEILAQKAENRRIAIQNLQNEGKRAPSALTVKAPTAPVAQNATDLRSAAQKELERRGLK